MTKKNKEKYDDEVVLSDEEYKLFKKMAVGWDKVAVIKVGIDEGSLEEQLERYRKANNDLTRKVAISTQEKAKFQTEVEKIKAVVDKDASKTLAIMEGMERDINELRKQNIGYSTMDSENHDMKRKISELTMSVADSKRKIESKDKQIEELTTENEELQTEIDIRIQQNSRFHNLDL